MSTSLCTQMGQIFSNITLDGTFRNNVKNLGAQTINFAFGLSLTNFVSQRESFVTSYLQSITAIQTPPPSGHSLLETQIILGVLIPILVILFAVALFFVYRKTKSRTRMIGKKKNGFFY